MTIKVFTRKLRRRVESGVRRGLYPLRVLGSEKMGFRLYAERGESLVFVGNRDFRRQKDAVAFGQDRYGQIARKKMLARAA